MITSWWMFLFSVCFLKATSSPLECSLLHCKWIIIIIFGFLYIYIYSVVRNPLKGSSHFLMLLHCSVQCFGFTMLSSKGKLPSFSLPLTHLELLWSQFTLQSSYFMPQGSLGYLSYITLLYSFLNLFSCY